MTSIWHHPLPVIDSCILPARHLHDAWILENPQDSADIARGISELCTSASTRARLLRRGAELIQSMSWRMVANKYEALYAQSIEERKGSFGP